MNVRDVRCGDKCILCSSDLRQQLVVYAWRTGRVLHRVCLEKIIGDITSLHQQLCPENRSARKIEKLNTQPLKRGIYVLVGAVSFCAFGVFNSLARSVMATVLGVSSGYLLAKGLDRYAEWRSIHRMEFV